MVNEILPFFLVSANLIWCILWRFRKFQHSWVLVIWASAGLFFSIEASLVFENDAYRYFVDGLHYAQGWNAYGLAPSESPLSVAFPDVFSKVGFSDVKTVYPPLVLFFFALLVKASQRDFGTFVILLKGLAMVSSSIGSFFAARGLRQTKLSLAKTTTFIAFHPFIVFEWYINLHFDVLIACTLTFAALGSRRLFPIALGVAASFKYLFLSAILFALDKREPLKIFFQITLAGSTFVAIVSLCQGSLPDLLENLKYFAANWEMNSGLFRLNRHIGYALTGSFSGGEAFAYGLFYSLSALTLVLVTLSKYSKAEKILIFFVIFILLSPVVNPWYFTWVFFLSFYVRPSLGETYHLSISFLPLCYTFFIPRFQENERFLIAFNSTHFVVWILLLTWFFRHDTNFGPCRRDCFKLKQNNGHCK